MRMTTYLPVPAVLMLAGIAIATIDDPRDPLPMQAPKDRRSLVDPLPAGHRAALQQQLRFALRRCETLPVERRRDCVERAQRDFTGALRRNGQDRPFQPPTR